VSVFEQIKPTKSDMEELARLFEGGAYRPIVDRVFPVSKIQEAHAFVETKAKKGNVAIEMTW
jgi:NADPH:quinone reductase-like Zn-dependent oxidoreductase